MGDLPTGFDVKQALQHFEEMKAERLPYDEINQKVADYNRPRKDFTLPMAPGQLRARRFTSNIAPNAAARFRALCLAYAIDPTRPFLLPQANKGFGATGANTGLDAQGQDYMSAVEWGMYRSMMRPKAQLLVQLGMALRDWGLFGGMVLWAGRRRGFGPYYRTRPVQSCWWSENEEGEIDTLYFRMMLRKRRVLQRWPIAQMIEGWDTPAARDSGDMVSVIHAVEPRFGGRPGATAVAKPFASAVFVEEKKALLEVSGYESFPFAVSRFDPEAGQNYSFGLGEQCLADTMVLSEIIDDYEYAVGKKARPSLAVPARLFGKTLDRRKSSLNAYNPMGLGLQKASDAILKIDDVGDPQIAMGMVEYLTNNIEMAWFVDWMRLADGANVTAEWVIDKRDLRLRGMSSIVSNLEPAMCALGDRTLQVMIEEDMVAPPPASLHQAEVDWSYAGPLAIAQLSGQARMAERLINLRQAVMEQDPGAASVIDLEESLRVAAEGLGAPNRLTKSREDVAAAKATQAQRDQEQHDAQVAQQSGAALQAGGAGLASLADAQDTAATAPGGGAPPPALPAPAALPQAA